MLQNDGGGTLTLTDQLRNGHPLRPHANRKAQFPSASDHGAWGWPLRQHSSFRHAGAVILTIDLRFERAILGGAARFGRSFPADVGNFDLTPMNCQPHGHQS